MKRSEAKYLAAKYGMEIIRTPVEGAAWAVYVETNDCIPELDALADKDIYPCVMVADYGMMPIKVSYKLVCPENWFDSFGWADD